MVATTRVPLGTPTLNRKWQLDVNTGTIASPTWVGVFGQTDFTPKTDPQTQDTSDFDAQGYMSNAVTALGWGADLKVSRKTIDGTPTAYDPGQEFIRLHAYQTGTNNTINIRYYEMEPGGPRIEAYQGNVGVTWSDDGGGMEAVSSASITLNGQGPRTSIAHPDTVGVAAPTVTAVTYSTGTTVAAAGGGLVLITGTGFASATVVTVFGNAVSAANWEAFSDTRMAIVVPAHAAGTGNIVITNPGGTSGTSAANQIVYV
jgi:hypothetical protein